MDLRQKVPNWVHWELQNWRKWVWEGSYPHPLPSRTCGSVEGEYQSPQHDSCEATPKQIPADADRAKRIDSLWRSLPPDQKLVLKVEYPARSEYEWSFGRLGVARKLKMRLTDYEAALFAAMSKVWRLLEKDAPR